MTAGAGGFPFAGPTLGVEKRMRTFVAIELPEAVRASLGRLRDLLRRSRAHASWVNTDNMHLTLRFLGEVDEESLESLGARLRDSCAQYAALTMFVRGTGVFPNTRRPSVVWAGLEAVSGDLMGLQAAIETAAQAIGLPPETKPFHPHVTLARIRDPRQIGDLLERIEAAQSLATDDFPVRAVALFSSELRPAGPVYRRLREFSLAC